MNLLYVKIGAYILLILGAFAYGWHIRDVDYMVFKKEVAATAEKQKAQTESVQKQHELVTKGIKDEYDAKLTTLRNYYKSTSVWDNNGSSTMSGISSTSKLSDAIAAYNQLASD